MKMKRIIIENLFDIFTHEILLNLKDHITIIYGPNGYGKTVLLTLLNALFQSNYPVLRRIPFSKLSIDFDDRSTLRLTKSIKSGLTRKANHNNKLRFEFRKKRSKPKTYLVQPIQYREFHFPHSIIEREIPGLERTGRDAWFYLPTRQEFTLEEVFEKFADRLPFPATFKRREPQWLKKIKQQIQICFIDTQRLLVFGRVPHLSKYEGERSFIPAVLSYSKDLARAIQSKLAEYGLLSQSLDRTFPTRIVKRRASCRLSIDQLKTELSELEQKRLRLMEAGFLDKTKEIDFKELKPIDKSNKDFLYIYIEDVKKKLSVFDELTDKIDLLVNIINSRFLYKRLSIDKKDGFVFKTQNGRPLQSTSLSSGEQHELVLFHELLFRVSQNSLILIDEPEISLHVIWQQQFLKDLQEITKRTGFDILIATHSPQIIHKRWDLTVKLEGPKE